MELALIGILTTAAVVMIVYPMLTRNKYRFDAGEVFEMGDTRQLNYLNGRKRSILENIQELDFEYEMGKLSDEDYNRLRQGYLAEAQNVIAALDQLKVRAEIEELIESDVRSRRRVQ